MKAVDRKLLMEASYKLTDTLEAINEGTWSCPDKDWKKDLENLLAQMIERLKVGE